MIDIADVLTQLKSNTTYLIEYAHYRQPTLEYDGTPLVYVGYGTFKSTIRDHVMDFDVYNTHGEGNMQIIETHLICPPEAFYASWKVVYKALHGFNPITTEKFRTAMCYQEGGVVGLDNGIQHHVDRWRIGFSTISTDF